jgi:hypothetical protein
MAAATASGHSGTLLRGSGSASGATVHNPHARGRALAMSSRHSMSASALHALSDASPAAAGRPAGVPLPRNFSVQSVRLLAPHPVLPSVQEGSEAPGMAALGSSPDHSTSLAALARPYAAASPLPSAFEPFAALSTPPVRLGSSHGTSLSGLLVPSQRRTTVHRSNSLTLTEQLLGASYRAMRLAGAQPSPLSPPQTHGSHGGHPPGVAAMATVLGDAAGGALGSPWLISSDDLAAQASPRVPVAHAHARARAAAESAPGMPPRLAPSVSNPMLAAPGGATAHTPALARGWGLSMPEDMLSPSGPAASPLLGQSSQGDASAHLGRGWSSLPTASGALAAAGAPLPSPRLRAEPLSGGLTLAASGSGCCYFEIQARCARRAVCCPVSRLGWLTRRPNPATFA